MTFRSSEGPRHTALGVQHMHTSKARIERMSDALAQAWRTRSRIDHFPQNDAPRDLDEALAVQTAFLETMGSEPSGWKAAGSGSGSAPRRALGEPMHGPLLESTFLSNDKPVSLSKFVAPKFELEIAIRVADTWSPGDRLPSVHECATMFSSAFVGCEIADSRHADYLQAGWLSCMADNSGMAGYIVGPELSGVDIAALRSDSARYVIDGKTVATELGGEEVYSACDIGHWLIQRIIGRGLTVRKGAILTLGTVTIPQSVTAGSTVEMSIGTFDPLIFRVVP